MKHKKKAFVIGGSVLGALAIGLGIFAAFFAACYAAVNFGGFLAENEEFIQWGFIILVPLLVMLLVCAVLTAQMRSAVEATEANRYLDNDSIEITHSHDSFDYTTTERIHHESKKEAPPTKGVDHGTS